MNRLTFACFAAVLATGCAKEAGTDSAAEPGAALEAPAIEMATVELRVLGMT